MNSALKHKKIPDKQVQVNANKKAEYTKFGTNTTPSEPSNTATDNKLVVSNIYN